MSFSPGFKPRHEIGVRTFGLHREQTSWSMTDQYRSTFENLPDAALTVASDGTVLLMNTAAERLFRFSVEEITGLPLETVIPDGKVLLGEGLPREKSGRVRLLASGIGLYGRRSTGEEFPMNVRCSWFEDGAGSNMTCLISELESWQPENKDVFQYIFDLAPVALIVTDDNDRILAANQSAEDAFGYSHTELRGCLLSALCPRRHTKPGAVTSWRVDEQGWAWGMRADGMAFPFKLSSAAIRTTSGMLHIYVIHESPARRRP